MSTVVPQAEASKPQQQQQKKMQECFKCKAAGFPNQLIGFEKIGENPTTGKSIWKLIDENGVEHKHRYLQNLSPEQVQQHLDALQWRVGGSSGLIARSDCGLRGARESSGS